LQSGERGESNNQNAKTLRSMQEVNLVVTALAQAIVRGNKTTMTAKRAKMPRKKPSRMEAQVIWGHDAVLDIYPQIQAFVIGRLGWQIGPDVVHQAIEVILEKLPQVRATIWLQFRAWCFRIARHKIADALRSKYASQDRIQPLDPTELVNIVEAGAEGGELSLGIHSDLRYLLALLRASKFPCDEVLWQHFIFGLGDEELAVIYGITKNAARMRIQRCWDAAKKIAKRHG